MSLQINLLNPLFRRKPSYFSLSTMLQALGFIILGSLAFFGYVTFHERQLNKQFAEETKRFETEKARMILLEAEFSPKQSDQGLQDEMQQMEKKLATQNALIETMKESAGGNAVGYSEYMRAFSRQSVPGLWLTSFKLTGDGSEINMSGAALDPELLPVYIQKLGEEKIMHGIAFATLQIKAGAADGLSAASLPRYVEFTLKSMPGGTARK